MDHEHLLGPALEFVEVIHGTNAGEAVPQLIGVKHLFNAFTDVTGGKARPDNVTEIGRGVIEDVHSQAAVMGAGNEGIAGTEAGAEHAKFRVALLLQPIEAAANVDDALSRSVNRASDVGTDGVIGAMKLRWHADVMVRHAKAQRGNSENSEEASEGIVTECIAIPLRNDDDGALWFSSSW